MKWLETVRAAFMALGGEAALPEVYAYIEGHTSRHLGGDWRARVRQTIEDNSPDSDSNRADGNVFRHVGAPRSGRWALLEAAVLRDYDINLEASTAAALGAFDARNLHDARRRVAREIAVRQGQPAFRASLLKAYEGRCAVTKCNVPDVLDAAHILAFRGEHTNHPQNGLLLRTDLHTLFDRGLIAVQTSDYRMMIATSLRATPYSELEGVPLFRPKDPAFQPSRDALDHHRKDFDAYEVVRRAQANQPIPATSHIGPEGNQ